MFKKLKKLLCFHREVTQSYKFQDKASVTLPDGRLLTIVAKFITVSSICARCGKELKNELIYEPHAISKGHNFENKKSR